MTRRTRITLLTVAASVLVLVSACPLCVLLQPASFRIARTRVIPVPPARVHAELADLRRMAAWDPRLGPEPIPPPTVTFSPVTSGAGAWIAKRGPDGTSRSTIVSSAPLRVELHNDVSGGISSGSSRSIFELSPVPSGTHVTYALEGDNDFYRRLLWPLANLESRLTPDLDAALLRLDAAARSP